MSRWKAAAIHFACSILIIASLAALLSVTWYPPSYLKATGGLGLIAILTGVNTCLGPLLTLIIFKSGKPGLKFDLSVITVLQIVALGYGLYMTYWARPVYMVFTVDRFELVSAANISPENLHKARRGQFRSLSLAGPQIIAAKPPADEGEREQLLFSSLSGGDDLQNLPQYYVPYEEMAGAIIRKAKNLDELMQRDELTRNLLTAYLSNNELQPAAVKFLPLRARMKDQIVLIDNASGNVLGIVDTDPW
jgi:hypothetical protein